MSTVLITGPTAGIEIIAIQMAEKGHDCCLLQEEGTD